MVNQVYSLEERLFMINYYLHNNYSYRVVRDLFIVEYPDRPAPSIFTIRNVVEKFKANGNVNPDLNKLSYPSRHTSEEVQVQICASAEINPKIKPRVLAQEVGKSQENVRRILKMHKYKPYKKQNHQRLVNQNNDQIRRMEFCENMIELINNDGNILEDICFSDESVFSIARKPNGQLHRHWSRTAPTDVHEANTQYRQNLHVWAGMMGGNIIRPYFLEGTLNADKYLDLLRNQIIPAIRAIEVRTGRLAYFQQDGAPAHNAARVVAVLNQEFPGRWIRTNSAILKWPARSPDVTPLDYFLWPHIENTLYNGQIYNIVVMRQRIEEIINGITVNVRRKAIHEFYNRLGYCLVAEGEHFEQQLRRRVEPL